MDIAVSTAKALDAQNKSNFNSIIKSNATITLKGNKPYTTTIDGVKTIKNKFIAEVGGVLTTITEDNLLKANVFTATANGNKSTTLLNFPSYIDSLTEAFMWKKGMKVKVILAEDIKDERGHNGLKYSIYAYIGFKDAFTASENKIKEKMLKSNPDIDFDELSDKDADSLRGDTWSALVWDDIYKSGVKATATPMKELQLFFPQS